MSILVLQSSWWGRESWLLCFICLPGVLWWLSGSSSRCHGVVCSLWLWYFLIILIYYFLWFSLQAKCSEPSLLKVCSINSVSFSLIRLWDNIVYRVEKSYVRGVILKFWSWRDISVTSNATCLKIVSNNNMFFAHTPLWQVLSSLKEWPKNDPKTAIPSMHWPIRHTVHIRALTIEARAVAAIHIYGCVMFIQKSIFPLCMVKFLYDLGFLGP